MDVIPFNVPGLPEPETLIGDFIIRPITVDVSEPRGGPALGVLYLPNAPRQGTPPSGGVFCIYPDIDMVAYLFDLPIRSGKDLLPGALLHSVSVDGVCALFGLSYDFDNNPLLIVTILPEQYLPKILTTIDGRTVADPSAIDDRLELTQTFTANDYGAVKRLKSTLTHSPKEQGSAIFDVQKDLDVIADVCSFYMTRAMTLGESEARAEARAAGKPVGSPIWALLWRATSARAFGFFSIGYILTQTSVTYDRLTGRLRIDYNRNVNRRPRVQAPQGERS